MKSRVYFGPAGNPLGFKGQTTDVCSYIRDMGLEAYEYQATYGVRIQKQSALKLGQNAERNDVRISLHAPYYINLSSPKEDVLKRSVQRLMQAARVAEWMGAYRIVFHPGFYTNYSPSKAMEKCKNTIRKLIEDLDSRGIQNYTFAPETTGKRSQLGSLEEIIDLCQSFDNFAPTIDFAHIHSRGRGCIKGNEEYHHILVNLEDALGRETLHCHFTRIDYTDAGERKHHILMEDKYGPPLEPLLDTLVEFNWDATIICETPLLERDALLMKEKYLKILDLG